MKRAFSLIELLLVVMVIAMLAGILFPVIAASKGQGSLTVALSQMKQLGTAVAAYAGDADCNMPPSTNYEAPESSPSRLWAPILEPYEKNTRVFIAPASDGQFATNWSERSLMTVGMNSASAYKKDGCEEGQTDSTGCQGFTQVASFDKADNPASVALFAVTPGGPLEKHYLGYEFNPYNGQPVADDLAASPPLCADRDLVKELPLPAELLEPVYARYVANGHGNGQTPVIFADGRAKNFSASKIQSGKSGIVWRFR
ncbi:hypothetical protein BH11ARM2_BH11ARM2_08500 [soil metagenome]